jgi:hypothetical protein
MFSRASELLLHFVAIALCMFSARPPHPTQATHADLDISHLFLLSQDLATGYMSGKLLLKLEAVHFMLGHHTSNSSAKKHDDCRCIVTLVSQFQP